MRDVKTPCPICGAKVRSTEKYPLYRKSKKRLLLERVSGNTVKSRRVCSRCWFKETTESMTKEEIAASTLLIIDNIYSSSTCRLNGLGRGFEDRVRELLQELSDG